MTISFSHDPRKMTCTFSAFLFFIPHNIKNDIHNEVWAAIKSLILGFKLHVRTVCGSVALELLHV